MGIALGIGAAVGVGVGDCSGVGLGKGVAVGGNVVRWWTATATIEHMAATQMTKKTNSPR